MDSGPGDRDDLEIRFPRVDGYRIELPETRLEADWTKVEPYVLGASKVGACEIEMRGIVGAPEILTLQYLGEVRKNEVIIKLASHMVMHKFRDADDAGQRPGTDRDPGSLCCGSVDVMGQRPQPQDQLEFWRGLNHSGIDGANPLGDKKRRVGQMRKQCRPVGLAQHDQIQIGRRGVPRCLLMKLAALGGEDGLIRGQEHLAGKE